jgi:TPR repeat protein
MKHLFRTALVSFVLAFTLAAQAIAGPLEDAMAAYQRQDFTAALRIFLPLADQGNADAQNNLGLMYDNGRGVPQDYVQAHKWFNLSASRSAAAERDQAVKNLEVIAAKMTPAQIAEAQRLAAQWKPN